MVKKNRHRAGRKKRERILRARQREAAELVASVGPARQIVRVQPQPREPPAPEARPEQRVLLEQEPFLVDLTEEDTVSPLNNENDPYLDSENDIEIIDEIPLAPANNIFLEPLNPDVEYHQNLTRIFINLEEYARGVFCNLLFG